MKTRTFQCIKCGLKGEQPAIGRPRRWCDACAASKSHHSQLRSCAACGSELALGSGLTYCSAACRPRRKEGRSAQEMAQSLSPEARERQRLYWQEKNRRRRAAKRGGLSESYSLAEIAVRDGFRCGLCGDEVPMTVKVPELLAPTIDHIVPVSKGGDDTRANVQLAHFLCNSVKGNRESDVRGAAA